MTIKEVLKDKNISLEKINLYFMLSLINFDINDKFTWFLSDNKVCLEEFKDEFDEQIFRVCYCKDNKRKHIRIYNNIADALDDVVRRISPTNEVAQAIAYYFNQEINAKKRKR